MKFKKQILFLALMVMLFSSCKGQSKQPDANVANQLSFTAKNTKLVKTQQTSEHQNIHCSLQDKNGNLWFGTTGEGVYKYDGKEFTQYTEKDGLSNNSVWCILEDAMGTIWFGTDDGISRYDGKTISRIPLSHSGKNTVWSMMQDKSGTIWLGTSEDLYCYDGISFSRFLDKYNRVENQNNLQLKRIQCLLQDSNGTIWMGSDPLAMEGVIRFDGKSITNSKPNGDGWIRYILEDKSKKIWFAGRGYGNFTYDGKSFAVFTQKTGIGNVMLVDKSGGIWFNGEEKLSSVENEGGIWRYDGKNFKNYTTSDGISKYYFFNMLEDREGNIWFGTRNCGLYRFDGKTFTSFSE